MTVTHPEVRRFFMTIPEAVGLVLTAGYGNYGTLIVLDMGEQVKIAELARYMITMSGGIPGVDVPLVFTGLRPGEKLYEELLTEDEERTVAVDGKILVVESPKPPRRTLEIIEQLADAACEENGERVLKLMKVLVPSFGTVEVNVGAPEAGLAGSWGQAEERE